MNEHRGIYVTPEEFLEDREETVEPEVLKKMIETDTVVNIHFYPDTPIGFYDIYHYDLEKALDEALECVGIK